MIEDLHQLYGTISIPPAVRSELSNSRAPEKVRNWIANSPAWIVIRSADSHPGQTLLHLGPGEREAIILAEQQTTFRLSPGLVKRLLDKT